MEARKLFLRTLLPPSIGSIAFILTITCLCAHEDLTRELMNRLDAVAALRTAQIRAALTKGTKRLNMLTGQHGLRRAVRGLLQGHSARQRRQVESILTDAATSIPSFHEILLLDSNGIVLAATDSSLRGDSWAAHPCRTGGNQVLDTNGSPCAYVSAPLLLNEHAQAVLVARTDAAEIIQAVLDSSGLGRTGEVFLAVAETPERARLLPPLPLDSAAAPTRIVDLRDKRHMLLQSAIGKHFLFNKAVDYRGKRVLAASHVIEPPGWTLLVKMDIAEAYESSTRLAIQGVVMLLIALGIMVAVSTRLSRDITAPLESMVYTANCGQVGDFRTPFKHDWPVAELANLGWHCNRMRQYADTTLTKQYEDVERLERRNRLLQALCAVDRLVITEHDRQRLLQRVCDILTTTARYRTAWITLVGEDGTRTATAFAGDLGYSKDILLQLIADSVPRCALEVSNAHAPVICRETDSMCVDCPLATRIRHPFHMMAHLVHGDRVRGSICIALPRAYLHNPDERTLFADIARNLGDCRLLGRTG